ncbi:hypothetical protein PM082_023251 [Marasmius tenuissimus]|nr:hypothetical protein PM082_023251 [Marasmius tenuissimus]
MSTQRLQRWSKNVNNEDESDTHTWEIKKSRFSTLDNLEVETFEVKRRKKSWQDQSPSKKSGIRRASKWKGQVAKERSSAALVASQPSQDVSANCNFDLPGGIDDALDSGDPLQLTEGQSEEELQHFFREFQEGRVGFYHVGSFVFIVQGWDRGEMAPSDKWYHFRAQKVGSDVDLDCRCPDGRQLRSCIHKECYREFREDCFRRLECYDGTDSLVVLFRRERLSDFKAETAEWLNMFSVQEERSHESELDRRAVVSFVGTDDGRGEWKCLSSRHVKASSCSHRKMAMKSFRVFNARVANGESDLEDVDSNLDDMFGPLCDMDTTGGTEEMAVVEPVNGDQRSEKSISYLPIRPPEWISLPSDVPHYPRTSPKAPIPDTITLQVAGRSNCDIRFSPEMHGMERIRKRCKVYTLTEELDRWIEVIRCPTCHSRKHCFIGPDPRSLGLFNYNNSVLLSHELLDEYVSRFTSTVSPFASFVEGMSRIYSGRGCSFVKEDLFQSAWFAYASLQDFSGDMYCPECLEEPDCVIWDGITLAYGKEYVTDVLKPPTYLEQNAPSRRRNYPEKPQMIPETRKEPIRRLLRRWVEGTKPKKRRKDTDSGDEDSEYDGIAGVDVSVYGTINDRLGRVSTALRDLFARVFSLQSKMAENGLKRLYRALFVQLVAEESLVQMVNWNGLERLQRFVAHPMRDMATQLTTILVVWKVLEEEWKVNREYPHDVVEACRWICERAGVVFRSLNRHEVGDLPVLKDKETEGDWRKVSKMDVHTQNLN